MGRSVDLTVAVEGVRETPFPDARLYEELRSQAIAETSAMFLHELRPLVGFLEGDAAIEIDRYECSRTKDSVNRVRSFLNAIERLRMASGAPALQEFDLTDLVVRVAADEVMRGRAIFSNFNEQVDEAAAFDDEAEQAPHQSIAKLSLGRRGPVATTGDPALVEMVAANALRNAIEAVLVVLGPYRNGVTLNWGVTDIDSWIVVHDEGCGLPAGWDRLNEPGISTKKGQGHLGMGLTIAQKAIESMRGSIRLTPRSGAGVSCEIRWPREGKAE